ncbi:calpain-B-like [Epargyreus clarus]|uniref:calpain-B-like n=1 Tax=Epargyreus clarus TaxID=520877 RepID=UPI003C2C7B4B
MKKFMRTRGAAPDAPRANGHANGVAGELRYDDQHSTLSRCCSAAGAAGARWEDAGFAPRAALGRRARAVRWLRPHELCARPRFMGDAELEGEAEGGAGEADAGEAHEAGEALGAAAGEAAARWRCAGAGGAALRGLRAAAAALAGTPRLLARAVPPHSFRRHYTGAFRFRFWVFGTWREVCVDDRLPVRGAHLLGSRGALPDDFTLPLLEKAYAKLYGSYAAAQASERAGGGLARALQELTGGVLQSFAPPQQPRALLYQVLAAAVPRSTLLVATAAPEKENGTRRLRNGLLAGQAYCVTGLARVRGAAGDAAEAEGGGALVRLLAPGGRGLWAGAWARGGPEWRALAPADRDLLARRAPLPGHFWMSFADFARAFGRLELVHVGPDDWLGEPALHGRRPWRAVLARRRWRAGYNAGGPPGARAAHCNPQFQLSVPRGAAGRCHVVVSVTQQYAPGGAASRLLAIGFAVYELPADAAPRRAALAPPAERLRALDVTHESRAREVATFFTLPPGQYLLVPHTRARAEAAFLLRVLTDDHTDVWEVNDDNVIIRDFASVYAEMGGNVPPDIQANIAKVLGQWPPDEAEGAEAELEAAQLRAAVRRAGGGRALAAALLALRDPAARARLPARDLPALLALLGGWRRAWPRGACALPAERLRALLWAAGARASNKVLEALVLRHAPAATLRRAAFLLALARLHLAHERFRALDAKVKSNPISLEEMILMTIYT